ncbi:MAG: hypothetical protein C0418_01930 [Coriobacteriaceae bacterium]|nr:hypothetical protein [Coriobacteriaceae bacterium]
MAGETVLVVEDTELLRRMYADKLAQDGFNVLAAGDGLEALAILRVSDVDLILLDLVMPRMSGLEVLDTVKKDPRTCDIPVLVLSNLGQESDVQRGMEMGAVDYLVKNEARPADVSEKIASVLHGTGPTGATLAAQQDEGPEIPRASFRLAVRDREADAEQFIEHAKLARRFWCPTCEVELVLELVPDAARPGWYEARLACPACARQY